MKILVIVLAVVSLMLGIMIFIDYTYDINRPGIGRGAPTSIVFDTEVMESMNEKFLETNDHEFIVCLSGYRDHDTVYIDDYYYPYQVSASTEGVAYTSCNAKPTLLEFFGSFFIGQKEVYGTMHNHANGVCRPSETDVYTFGHTYDWVMGIICGVNEVVVYTPDSLSESIPAYAQDL